MKVKYDKETDVLYIQLNEVPVVESDEERKGVILDYGKDGKVVGIEILNASQTMPQPTRLEYEVA